MSRHRDRNMSRSVIAWSAHASGAGRPRSAARRARHRRHRRRAVHPIVGWAKVMTALVSAVLLVVVGIGWLGYRNLASGITTSAALSDEPASAGADQNILVMGLDTRRDQQGGLLPQDIYDALHAGDENSGENDADVLIVLHVPSGAGQVTAISIPRDDYVDLAGCPAGECRGKIKQAYRLAYQRVIDGESAGDGRSAADKTDTHDTAREQRAREAGRKAEIGTVRRLLQIPIDHFIEVSLAAFVQIARVVQPVTVCLAEDTSDPYYSGADFHKGIQQINAAQAIAFVRQRRDVNNESFTDLDRTRRQQAFLASLITALRHHGALSDPTALHQLAGVAQRNVAVDAGFDLPGFIRSAVTLGDGPLALYTLPITEFSRTADGEDVNIIDVATIRSTVRDLLSTDSPSTAANTSTAAPADSANPAGTTAPAMVLNVINATGQEDLAALLEKAFATGELSAGTASTADSVAEASTIDYGPGAQAAAATLARRLDLTASASDAVAPSTVQLTVGTDLRAGRHLDDGSAASHGSTTTSATAVTTVAATATGTAAPAPTDLTRMSAQNVPCVR